MTVQSIIKLLKTSGINSKHRVASMLENATDIELVELRNSIEEIIRIKRAEE